MKLQLPECGAIMTLLSYAFVVVFFFYRIKVIALGSLFGARRSAEEDSHYWRITQWLYPSYSLMPRETGAMLQCNMRIPIDDHNHWFFRTNYHPGRALSPEELYEFRVGGNQFQEVIPGTYLRCETWTFIQSSWSCCTARSRC